MMSFLSPAQDDDPMFRHAQAKHEETLQRVTR
jgi:hypothetical protein